MTYAYPIAMKFNIYHRLYLLNILRTYRQLFMSFNEHYIGIYRLLYETTLSTGYICIKTPKGTQLA